MKYRVSAEKKDYLDCHIIVPVIAEELCQRLLRNPENDAKETGERGSRDTAHQITFS